LFQPEDVNALCALANQAAIAIENARLFSSIQEKATEIATLKTEQDNVLASIASGVIATDLQNRITSFNRAAESILAIPAQQALGHPCREILTPLIGAMLPELIDTVRRGVTSHIAVQVESNMPGRGCVDLYFNVSALKDERGDAQGVTIVVDDVTEKRQLQATREMFRRYVSPAVVDRLPSNPDELRLGGRRQEVTILFADIRGFTRLSESLPPEELVVVLNQYLAVAADAILKEEGTLDKFMGDAVMAIFNAPLPQEEHTLRAARAALDMKRGIAELHARLPKELRLKYGIGIHTGEAIVGNVGTQQLLDFTAIGDAVNLAERLQENASGGQIILSHFAYSRVRSLVRATALPKLKVKGRRRVEQVWELEGLVG
jgi:adenylate cyclase